MEDGKLKTLELVRDTEHLLEAKDARAGLDAEFRKLPKVERDSMKNFWTALLHMDRVAFRKKEEDFLVGKERTVG